MSETGYTRYGSSQEGSSMYDSAKKLAEDARRESSLRICSGRNTDRDALTKYMQSLNTYGRLLDMSNQGSESFNSIFEDAKKTMADAFKLLNIMQACNYMADKDDFAKMYKFLGIQGESQPGGTGKFQIGTDKSICVNIPLESQDDVPIVQRMCSSIITNACSFTSFDDYVGGEFFEKMFEDIVVNPLKFTQFRDAHPGTISILLFGPPGTGKTFLAKATVSLLSQYGARFMSISASDIKGRYVGESEKGMKYLFAVARALTNGGKTPVVIFIDEIEGLIEESKGSESGSQGLLGEFNKQVQGLTNSSNDGLIVIGATNYPEKIPTAAIQRFTEKPFVGLPSLDDARGIIMKKLHKMGWSRVNFSSPNPNYPLWLQSVDWNRDQFITNYLGITDINSKNVEWSYPGQFDITNPDLPGHFTRKVSRLIKYSDSRDVVDQLIPPAGTDLLILDTTNRVLEVEKCPWDVVDYMAYLLFNGYYAPREIDGVFATMSTASERRSYDFATSVSPLGTRVFFQKWLLEKTFPVVREAVGNTCKEVKKPARYSFIPLWYSLEDGEQEKKLLRDNSEIPGFKVGDIWGFQKDTHKDGTFNMRVVPKFTKLSANNKQSEIKIVISKTEITDSVPVAKQIKKIEHANRKIQHKIVQKQAKDVKNLNYDQRTYKNIETFLENIDEIINDPRGVNEDHFNTNNYPHIPTEEWKNIPPHERLSPENMPKVIGISQTNLNDFLIALGRIKSIPIKNVNIMLEYAKTYGYSAKKGQDIDQLEKQAVFMKGKSGPEDDNSRYIKAWKQMMQVMEEMAQ